MPLPTAPQTLAALRRIPCLMGRHAWLFTGRMRWGNTDTYHLRYHCHVCGAFRFRQVLETQ